MNSSVISIEIPSPRRNSLLVDGLRFRDDLMRVMRSIGCRVPETARGLTPTPRPKVRVTARLGVIEDPVAGPASPTRR